MNQNLELDTSLLPKDKDIAFYREHGWWISPVILPEELLDDARHGAERHYAGERDAPLPLSGGYLDWTPEQGEMLRLNDYVSLQNDQIRELLYYPMIAATAGLLSGAKVIRLFHDQLVNKPAGLPERDSSVGWHVDAAYWQTATSRSLLTAWIPFQDCDESMGPIAVVDRSHLWPDNEWMKTFNDRDLEKLEQSFRTNGEKVEKIPLTLKKGQVSFHHCRTIHGSMPNRSRKDRLAFAIHLQDETNRYRKHINAAGKETLHINDLLVRRGPDGLPDYSDPEICPVLWEAPVGVEV